MFGCHCLTPLLVERVLLKFPLLKAGQLDIKAVVFTVHLCLIAVGILATYFGENLQQNCVRMKSVWLMTSVCLNIYTGSS